MSKVITDQKYTPLFVRWLDERCPGFGSVEGTIHTIAFVDPQPDNIARQEDVLTVCALSRWTPHSCEATLASNGAKRAKASREYIWTIFNHVFNVHGRSRLYVFVGVENAKSIVIQAMLGLTQEAVLRDHFGEGKDALLFGITKTQWLAGQWASADTDDQSHSAC